MAASLCLTALIILFMQWTESWSTLMINSSVITFLVTLTIWWMSFGTSNKSNLRAVFVGVSIPIISLFLLMMSLWSAEFDFMQNLASGIIMTFAGLTTFGIVLLPVAIAISVFTHVNQMRDV